MNIYWAILIILTIILNLACKPISETESELAYHVDTVALVQSMCKKQSLSSVMKISTGGLTIISQSRNHCGHKKFSLQDQKPTHRYIHVDMGGSSKNDASVRRDAKTTAKLGDIPGATYTHLRGTQTNIVETVKNLNISKDENVTFIISGHGVVSKGDHKMVMTNAARFEDGTETTFQEVTSTKDLVKGLYGAANITPENKANLIISSCFSGRGGEQCMADPSIAGSTETAMTSSTGNQESKENDGGEYFLQSYVSAVTNPQGVRDINKNNVIDTEDLVQVSKLRINQSTSISAEEREDPSKLPENRLSQTPELLTGAVPLATPLATTRSETPPSGWKDVIAGDNAK